VAQRAQAILMAAQGATNVAIADHLRVARVTVGNVGASARRVRLQLLTVVQSKSRKTRSARPLFACAARPGESVGDVRLQPLGAPCRST